MPARRALRAADAGASRSRCAPSSGPTTRRPRSARSRRSGFLLGTPPQPGHRRAPAARPRDVPARRPAAEVGHRVDGALARAALAAARPPRRRARARAAGDAEVPRARGQGRAAPRVRRPSCRRRSRAAARAASAFRSRAGSAASCGRSPRDLLLDERRAVARLVPRRARSSGCSTSTPPSAPTTATGLWTLVHARALAADARRGGGARGRARRDRVSAPHRLPGARVRLRGAAARDPAPRARRDHRLVHGEERHVRADVRAARDVRLPRRASRRRTRSRSTAGSSIPVYWVFGRSWESIGIAQLAARRS